MSTWHADPPPFVVVEGLDGAGTTTQVERSVARLRESGRPTVATREPSDGPIGALVRQMLSGRVVAPSGTGEGVEPIDEDALALMFAADRIDHVQSTVEPALEAGRAVVSDRYYPSNVAYQGTFDGDGEFDCDWVSRLNERARRPDLIVYLEASAELCLERLADRTHRDRYEEREELERLERSYARVMDQLESTEHSVLRLDATRSREALTEAIVDAVLDRAGEQVDDDPS